MNNSATKTIPQILKDNICTVFNLLNFLIAAALAAVGAWKNMLFIIVIIINTGPMSILWTKKVEILC